MTRWSQKCFLKNCSNTFLRFLCANQYNFSLLYEEIVVGREFKLSNVYTVFFIEPIARDNVKCRNFNLKINAILHSFWRQTELNRTNFCF